MYQERSKGENKRKEIEQRLNARHLSVIPEKMTPLLLNENPAALARSQAPIVYHTRVQIWRRHAHMSWALSERTPHGDDV